MLLGFAWRKPVFARTRCGQGAFARVGSKRAAFVARLFGVALLGAPAACAGHGQYVWFNELPADVVRASGEYVIGAGDTVNIRVLGHEDMSVKGRVRSDGRLAIPLIGEVEVRGKRPAALRAELEGRLKDYIVSPTVTVNVDEAEPITVPILGEVARPGAYSFEANTGLAQALALSGGLSEYASRDSIFVVRRDPRPLRIRFTYEAVSQNTGQAAGFPLHRCDLVVVE
jgi:polysaccharide export outer membrane protein